MGHDASLILAVGLGISGVCLVGIILALQVVRAAMNSDENSGSKKNEGA